MESEGVVIGLTAFAPMCLIRQSSKDVEPEVLWFHSSERDNEKEKWKMIILFPSEENEAGRRNDGRTSSSALASPSVRAGKQHLGE